MAQVKYFSSFKTVFSELKKHSWLFIIISAVLAGIAVQQNWIHEHCAEQKFFENGGGVCKDNKLRIMLGGPVFLIAELLIITSIAYLYLRFSKEAIPTIVVNRIALASLALSLMALGPALNYKQSIFYGSFLLFLVLIIALLPADSKAIKDAWWPPLEGSIDIKVNKENIEFTITGSIAGETASTLYESLLWQAPNDMQPKPVTVDIKEVTQVDAIGVSILLLIESLAAAYSQKIEYTGDAAQIKDIKEKLKTLIA